MATVTAAARITLQPPPLALDREGALAFMGIAPKLFDALERAGRITGKPLGRNGARIYQRSQLEEIVAGLFGAGAANDIDDEFAALGGDG